MSVKSNLFMDFKILIIDEIFISSILIKFICKHCC